MRTAIRSGLVPGQPPAELTGHGAGKSAPAERQERHYCGECFGPRSRYSQGPFCSKCEAALFGGLPGYAYMQFIRSERARRRERAKR